MRHQPTMQSDEQLIEHYINKVMFREASLQKLASSERVDEVLLLLHSGKKSQCNHGLIREAIRAALALRKFCVRCDFDITLVANDPIYSAFHSLHAAESSNPTLIAGVFDRMVKSNPYATTEEVFAAHKPRDMLEYSTKPFVIFIDADIYANDETFPESVFDMLHQNYDVILPIDWAHRHGPLWGRGVPGLCTCIFGFMNAPNVRRVIELWQQEIEQFASDPMYHKYVVDTYLPDEGYQFRDQELLSLVFHHNTFPDVKLFTLSTEWVCANQGRESATWVEGAVPPATLQGKKSGFQQVFEQKCKTLHAHSNSMRAFDTYRFRDWLENLGDVGEPIFPGEAQRGHGCSGAKRRK